MKLRNLLLLVIAVVTCTLGCQTANTPSPQSISQKGVTLVQDDEVIQAKDNLLPDLFRFTQGKHVKTVADWRKRREEILYLLAKYEYGHLPPAPKKLDAVITSRRTVFEGTAEEVRVTLRLGPQGQVPMQIGLYIPTAQKGKRLPLILAVDPVWDPSLEAIARRITQRGYIFAGYDKHDIDKDDADRSDGLHPVYPDYDWATLSVWAWGAMRTMDYLVTCPEVDASHVAITGHSRAGKTALWAGANDERFTLVAPHASGAGGAGCFLYMNKGTETLEVIASPKRFHYWFVSSFGAFTGKEDTLPFDQHFLKACVAPRALLSVEGLGDRWANPHGTQMTYEAAQPVFDFLGASNHNNIFFREGGHDTTPGDWEVLLDYADSMFFGKTGPTSFNNLAFPRSPIPSAWRVPQKP